LPGQFHGFQTRCGLGNDQELIVLFQNAAEAMAE